MCLTRASRPRPAPGFTLIELTLVMLIAAVLATIGLPLYQAQARRAHRSEALVEVARIQQLQERWRGEQPQYAASLTALGLSGTSAQGHYRLSTAATTGSEASAYAVTATAQGSQTEDQPCQVLQLERRAGQLLQRSGPDSALGNDAASNRRCWQP